MRVAVVGGGVVGLACAHAVAERGAHVILLEGATVGSGASRGNTGWIVPSISMPLASPGMLSTGLRSALDPRGSLVIRPAADTTWLRWLWQFRRCCSLDRFRAGVEALVELNRHTFDRLDAYAAQGIEFESHSTGILVVARDPKGLTWFSTLFDELRAAGFDGTLEQLNGDEARELEPALGSLVTCALRTRVDRHVQPESLMRGLAEHLDRGGVEIREGAVVSSIARAGTAWRLSIEGDDAEPVDADRVVLAAGAATSRLLGPLGVRLPLVAAKGYSIDVRGEGEPPRMAMYLSEAKIGLSPFADGVRIAGVFELPGRSATVDDRRIRQLVDDTSAYLSAWRPTFNGGVQRGWAGMRPATPDGLPLIGPVPGLPGIVLATGHGMLGVTLAPATGAVVADLVSQDAAPTWLAPFRPDRQI